MTQAQLLTRMRDLLLSPPPLPGHGQTAIRHRSLLAIGREDLSLARIAEAHWDAVAILTEAGREPAANKLYAVWASEKPGQPLTLQPQDGRLTLNGSKWFCSGAGLVDRALVTVSVPEQHLIDVDLRAHAHALCFDDSDWKTNAFAETKTARVDFNAVSIAEQDLLGAPGWYLNRPGFWHGACGPAACWAGGAARFFDYALRQKRRDPHTLAHLAAMHAAVWGLGAALDVAGDEIDAAPDDSFAARLRARTVRHLVEQASTEILRRLPRAYGPYPLAMDEDIGRHYQELDLYLRQWHAERDLEALGFDLVNS